MTVDPTTDPRAAELMAIDDTVLSGLIARFLDATHRASFASRGLTAAANETVWSGEAATSFKSSIGKMPRQLDQVLGSYYGVRVALEAYQRQVDELKLRWTRAVAAIEQAKGPYRAASSAVSSLTRSLEQVLSAQARGQNVATNQIVLLSREVSQESAQLRQVAPAYAQACAQGMSVLDEFDRDRDALCSAIAAAAQHGRYVTIDDRTNVPMNEQHVIVDINGQFHEEGGISSGGAPNVHRFTPSPEYVASFSQILHPAGM